MWTRTANNTRVIEGLFMHDRANRPYLYVDDPEEMLDDFRDRYVPFEILEGLVEPGTTVRVTIEIIEP